MIDKIADFANLIEATRVAAREKRTVPEVASFLLEQEARCFELADLLRRGVWQPSAYRVFRVVEPKERTICAAPFCDRVVHQALVQVIAPSFERGFVADSYACRVGKGTHAALARIEPWVRTYRYALKLDVRKFFPSVDHEVALALVARRVRCPATLDLMRSILASWRSSEAPMHWFPGDGLFDPTARARGIPIGNLTSRFLANVVLDPVDHAAKDGFGIRGYARYCDDLVAFADDVDTLRALRERIVRELTRLRLVAHPTKTRIQPTSQGVAFVGFVVHANGVRVEPSRLASTRRRWRKYECERARGALTPLEWSQRCAAWDGHALRTRGGGRRVRWLLPSMRSDSA